jgi:3-dehydroquinate synthase
VRARAQTASADVMPVHVDLGPRSYDIFVGEGLLATAADFLRPLLAQQRVIVVTDERVAGLHLDPFATSLAASGIAYHVVVLPPGEQTKDFAHLQNLCERILDLQVERNTLLLALGGGVIGDIVGFAAGILLRGLDFVQVPTSLLAQVDSSVGGKTGINTRQGKNLVGLFHQPRLVLADVGTLATLDARQMRAGYAEVVKYGLLGDTSFFEWLEANGERVLAGDAEALRYAVATSCRAKAAIVAEDEREAGRRASLNLGHTFGHALEAETGFGDTLLHGEAVAIGMVLAFELSARLGLAPAGDVQRVRRHLARVGLPIDLTCLAGLDASADGLLEHMRTDKKVRDGRLTFILARGIGRAFVCRDVKDERVRALLNTSLKQSRDSLPQHS